MRRILSDESILPNAVSNSLSSAHLAVASLLNKSHPGKTGTGYSATLCVARTTRVMVVVEDGSYNVQIDPEVIALPLAARYHLVANI
jgi:hypothetical protein